MRIAGLSIARNVVFRSRTGNYDVPAIITATVDSLNPDGVKAFEESDGQRGVPPLTDPDHVHLTVLTPGIPGQRATADDFEVVSEHPVQENVGGTYQEWNVPYSDAAGVPGAEHKPGTWRFPERV